MAGPLLRRQLWATETTSLAPHCTAFHLPALGTLILNESVTLTLAQDAVFAPQCTDAASIVENSTLPLIDFREPFSASTIPQIFALGAMLIIAWSLVIILIMAPGTSYVIDGSGNGRNFLGGGGILGAGAGAPNVISGGGRPWLQKVAAGTVAISLLIASINTFAVVEDQYDRGYEDADAVTNAVVGSLELKIIRVISDTFLWLAQTQTLIRLFPRHREKVIIKWTGFGLITLDTLFSMLNSFLPSQSDDEPTSINNRRFSLAIPALSYLFDLALSLIYLACVLYYSLVKRRFSYFHSKMRTMCVVALLSIVSISIPVVFFIIDMAQPTLAGWGDYVRWAGAAAASVVVWEWVERIEALERDERKDGILGREIFEGDEMLETTPQVEVHWSDPHSHKRPPDGGSSDNSGGGGAVEKTETKLPGPRSGLMDRIGVSRRLPMLVGSQGRSKSHPATAARGSKRPLQSKKQAAPIPVTSPVSRSDTNSAASTVYTVFHHPVSASPTPPQDAFFRNLGSNDQADFEQAHILPNPRPQEPLEPQTHFSTSTTSTGSTAVKPPVQAPVSTPPERPSSSMFHSMPNPFKRRRKSPPLEVSAAAVDLSGAPSAARSSATQRAAVPSESKWGISALKRHRRVPAEELPFVVVPAQPRGRVWNPSTPVQQDEPVAAQDHSIENEGLAHNRDEVGNHGGDPLTRATVAFRLEESIGVQNLRVSEQISTSSHGHHASSPASAANWHRGAISPTIHLDAPTSHNSSSPPFPPGPSGRPAGPQRLGSSPADLSSFRVQTIPEEGEEEQCHSEPT